MASRRAGPADAALGHHLELLQGVISRMAGCQFLLKGWSITVVSALLAVSIQQTSPLLAAIAVVPTLMFWGLDAYYLRLERLFRALYRAVRLGQTGAGQAVDGYSMDFGCVADEVDSWRRTLPRPSVALFHGVLLVLVLVVAAFSTATCCCSAGE